MKYILNICNEKNINNEVIINAWVKKIRKMGSKIFMDLYDTSGLVQVVVNENNKDFEIIEKLPKESVVSIKGMLLERKSKNENLPTGNVEIILNQIKIHSKSDLPPLLIQDDTDALEDTRLKYRYLDLRRPIVHNNIKFRSNFLYEIRRFLHKNNFIEIETPYLCKQTPEGARDYLVPTRNGKFFALPQSPQIFKQLLMVSGFMKYFQITRCFRDEDLRADRQPEFTQLDMEMSFVNEEVIFKYIEALWNYVIKKTLNISIPQQFERMEYKDAIEFYGSDKPDLRYDYKIFDLKDEIKNEIINNDQVNGLFAKAIIFDNLKITSKQKEKLNKYLKDNGASRFYWINYDGASIDNKYFDLENITSIFKNRNIENGFIVIVVDNYNVVHKSLGAIRSNIISEFNIKPKEELKFSWIVNWPLYEYDENENKYSSAHHPFTSPSKESLKDFDTNKKDAKARAYDLVLNGYEIGGGSIRIHNPDLQTRVFKSLGLSEQEIQEKFGFMINAFKYGVPPHGGIAFGIERILMILLKTETIRDVIAFPKNSSGYDMMQETPSDVDDSLLEELQIKKYEKDN